VQNSTRHCYVTQEITFNAKTWSAGPGLSKRFRSDQIGFIVRKYKGFTIRVDNNTNKLSIKNVFPLWDLASPLQPWRCATYHDTYADICSG
jgi:hypothetical protein